MIPSSTYKKTATQQAMTCVCSTDDTSMVKYQSFQAEGKPETISGYLC